jgi:hypothetical protein
MVSFLNRMPTGFPGRVTRAFAGQIITQEIINTSTPPLAYGLFVKLVSGTVSNLQTGDTAAVVYGVTVSPFPAESTNNTINSAATPPTSGIIDVLKQGYVAVAVPSGVTPVKGSPVFVCINSADGTLGQLAIAAATGFVQVPNAMFMGGVDSNLNAEISFNIDLPQ